MGGSDICAVIIWKEERSILLSLSLYTAGFRTPEMLFMR